MGDDLDDLAAPLLGRPPLDEQQQVFSVVDGPGVLHGAVGEVGDRHRVELGVGIGDAEVRLLEQQQLGGGLQREAELAAPTLGRDASQRHRPGAHGARRNGRGLDDVKRAHGPGHQVSRQRPGRREANALLAGAGRLLGARRRVGDGHVGGPHHQAHLEGRLEARLVEAREGPAGEDVFELRKGVAGARFFRQVQPHDARVEVAAPGQLDRGGARADGPGEAQPHHPVVVHLLVARRERLCPLLDGGGGDAKVPAVQPQDLPWGIELDGDLHLAAEARLAGVDAQLEAVSGGPHVTGEAEGEADLELLAAEVGASRVDASAAGRAPGRAPAQALARNHRPLNARVVRSMCSPTSSGRGS